MNELPENTNVHKNCLGPKGLMALLSIIDHVCQG
jgi:hypothetical protein